MSAVDRQRQAVIEHTRRSYGQHYARMKFPSPDVECSAAERRVDLLSKISQRTESLCGGAKFVIGSLPAGCTLCTRGAWSCLFVNGRCNADCFFCPKDRDPRTLPNADGVVFRSAAGYVEYLRAVGFEGVGISGGEPLLSGDATVDFIDGIKRVLGSAVFVWLYTNGLLASDENLAELNAAGLDEIRFNIAADCYSVESVQRAARFFDDVVVEIPAIPEDAEKIQRILPKLTDLGVRCLNLHQLWCSPQNAPQLIERGYTFLHGPRVAILESELMALEVLELAADHPGFLPIHYCSAVYKQRYQTAAGLRRDACLVAHKHEDITQAGLIRQLSLSGHESDLMWQRQRFERAASKASDYHLDRESGRLFFKAELWDSVDFSKFAPRLQYEVAHARHGEHADGASIAIPIAEDVELRLARSPVHVQPSMSESEQALFETRVVMCEPSPAAPYESFEWIDSGLPDYF